MAVAASLANRTGCSGSFSYGPFPIAKASLCQIVLSPTVHRQDNRNGPSPRPGCFTTGVWEGPNIGQ